MNSSGAENFSLFVLVVSSATMTIVSAVVTFVATYVWHLRGSAVLQRRRLIGQRNAVKGSVSEQLAPLLHGFHYRLSDARFLGSPFDYLVFDGYSGDGDIEVVFVEIKSGSARLSSSERRIRDAVEKGRVRFEIVRIDE